MAEIIDLVGERFGRLQVIGLDEDRNKLENERVERGEIVHSKIFWMCRCDCEKTRSVAGASLRNRATQSCGCLKRNKPTKQNTYEELEDCYLVWNEEHTHSFLISKEDFEKCSEYYWGIKDNGYWYTSIKISDFYSTRPLLHQYIIVNKEGEYDKSKFVIDHIDRNPSNNKRENLEIKTQGENTKNRGKSGLNTSGVSGVSWRKDIQEWAVRIGVDGKRTYLGSFKDKKEAIRIREQAKKDYGYIGE